MKPNIPEIVLTLEALVNHADAASGPTWELVRLSGSGGPFAVLMPYSGNRTFYGISHVAREEDAAFVVAARNAADVFRQAADLIRKLWSEPVECPNSDTGIHEWTFVPMKGDEVCLHCGTYRHQNMEARP